MQPTTMRTRYEELDAGGLRALRLTIEVELVLVPLGSRQLTERFEQVVTVTRETLDMAGIVSTVARECAPLLADALRVSAAQSAHLVRVDLLTPGDQWAEQPDALTP